MTRLARQLSALRRAARDASDAVAAMDRARSYPPKNGSLMTNDAHFSKYRPLALQLLGEYDADAVFVAIAGGTRGHGACPAMYLTPGNTPEAIASNTAKLRALQGLLREAADRLELDIRAAGFRLESAS